MKVSIRIILFFQLLVLGACGIGEGVNPSIKTGSQEQSSSTSTSSAPPVEVKIIHQCDLSAYVNLEQNRVDFSYSTDPAVTVRRRYIDLFRSVSWSTQAQKETQIRNLLRVNRLTPQQIQVRIEQPICTASNFMLGEQLEEGVLPLQELLEAECPELKSHNIFSDVDTDLEQQLADKIRRDFTEEEYAEFVQPFHAHVIDLLIENSSYLGLTFGIKKQGAAIIPEFTQRQKEINESQGWLTALFHSQGNLCIE